MKKLPGISKERLERILLKKGFIKDLTKKHHRYYTLKDNKGCKTKIKIINSHSGTKTFSHESLKQKMKSEFKIVDINIFYKYITCKIGHEELLKYYRENKLI